MNFLLRFVLTTIACYTLTWMLSELQFRDQAATLLASVAIALFNSLLRPFRIVRSQPFTIYTLAILATIANTGLVLLFDRFIPGFDIAGAGRALLVGFCVTVVSFTVDRFVRAE
jgi:uncharacterized membrane protein YvlD (DUF360 family)